MEIRQFALAYATDIWAREGPEAYGEKHTGMWRDFWGGGAFVDIAGRTADPRAAELERRAALLEPAQISRVSPRTVM